MASPRLVALGERRRQEIVEIVSAHIAETGMSPTIAEIAQRLQIEKSAVRRHVQTLVGQGLLTQIPGKARTLQPVRRGRRRKT